MILMKFWKDLKYLFVIDKNWILLIMVPIVYLSI